jgi:geranylgeranyl pyrophosphate synthase
MQDHLLATALEQTIHRYGEDAGALSQAARHHLSRSGKRTRSKLLFAATPKPQNIKALVQAAAAVELIHEASIVHDDIQDQTERRRGMPTVWRQYGANTALLLGDHLVASAFRAVAEARQIDTIKGPLILALSQSVSRAASGQHLQLTNATQGEFQAFYNEVAINKTGALIALPLQFAALLNGSANQDTSSARRCGEQLGLAYQVLDDLKPYATPNNLAADEDIQHRVITAPVAACSTLFPKVDPFHALVNNARLRSKAIRKCQHWLNTALANARYEATYLSAHSALVVEHFITGHLTSPPIREAQSTPTYSPWQKQTAVSVEAV